MNATERRIVQFVSRHPGASLREVAAQTGIHTTSHVRYCLCRLRDRGVLAFEDGLCRTLRLAPGIFVDSNGAVYRIWQPEAPETRFDMTPPREHETMRAAKIKENRYG